MSNCGVEGHTEDCLCDVDISRTEGMFDEIHLPAWQWLRALSDDPYVQATAMLTTHLDLAAACLEAKDTLSAYSIPDVGDLVRSRGNVQRRITPTLHSIMMTLLSDGYHRSNAEIAEMHGVTEGTVADASSIIRYSRGRSEQDQRMAVAEVSDLMDEGVSWEDAVLQVEARRRLRVSLNSMQRWLPGRNLQGMYAGWRRLGGKGKPHHST